MEPQMIGLIVLGVLTLIWFVSAYNRLIRMRNECERAWSNIDVLLQQRYDMLPNLVNTVKGYASHEKDIFLEFAEARKMAVKASAAGDVGGVSAAEGLLGGIMPRIFAIAEAYPELKADESFVNLQDEIVSIENQVADRREFYNSAVTNWNTAIEQIPTNFVGATMGAERKMHFPVETDKVRHTPHVEF